MKGTTCPPQSQSPWSASRAPRARKKPAAQRKKEQAARAAAVKAAKSQGKSGDEARQQFDKEQRAARGGGRRPGDSPAARAPRAAKAEQKARHGRARRQKAGAGAGAATAAQAAARKANARAKEIDAELHNIAANAYMDAVRAASKKKDRNSTHLWIVAAPDPETGDPDLENAVIRATSTMRKPARLRAIHLCAIEHYRIPSLAGKHLDNVDPSDQGARDFIRALTPKYLAKNIDADLSQIEQAVSDAIDMPGKWK